MPSPEFRDLNLLAQKRTRDAAVLVMQLLDDDNERIGLLISIALDFLNGAAEHLKQTAEDEDQTLSDSHAFGIALGMVMITAGPEKVTSAFKYLKRQRSTSNEKDL